MTPVLWMATGAGAVMLLGLVVMCAMERELREALGQCLLALFVAPILLFRGVFRRLPRAIPLSAAALERFASQQSGTYGRGSTRASRSAWLLGYAGHGVIVVRRRRGRDWLNDVPNRAARCREDARRYGASSRPRVREVDE